MDVTVMAVTDARYLDRSRWDDVNTAELRAWTTRSREREAGASSSRVEVAAGQSFAPAVPERYWHQTCYMFPPQPCPPNNMDVFGGRRLRGSAYGRGLLDVRRDLRAGGFDLRFRVIAAGTLGGTRVPLQRRIFLGGADPYATFANPFLRSRGALFARDAVHYQAPGGVGLRGYAAAASATWVVALNAEAGLRLLERPRRRLFSAITLAAFADVALLDRAALGGAGAADAGLGIRAAHRIGPTRFVTRVDLPVLVSRPAAVVAGAAGDGAFKFRWVWSLEEAF